MINTIQKNGNKLSTGQVILHCMACIAIFVATAIICDLLTLKISSAAIRIATRELILRMPLTILMLHIYSRKVVKVYDPATMYGKFSITGLVKWAVIGFMISIAVWLFYYLFHFAVVLRPAVPLNTSFQIELLIKWISISIAAGFAEEVLFRGHLFMIIRDKCRIRTAILITSIIFGTVHIAMLPVITPEDIMIVLLGGTITGILFTAIYMYSQSIWCAAIVHSIWDIFFIGKITTVVHNTADTAKVIAAFKLTSKNMLLTGGNFGLETGLPAFVCYLLVIISIFVFQKRAAQSNYSAH